MEFKFEGNSLKAGVYKITNTQCGKVYIGSARRFKERWKAYRSSLVRGKHYNIYLQASFDKYGEDAFVFEVLEITAGTTEERRQVEQKYINEYLNRWELCYNFDKCARNPQKSWSGTPETTRKKKSEACKKRWADPNYKKKMSVAMKEGWTEEVRKEASGRLMGERNPMFGKEVSIEARKHLSETSKEMWAKKEIREKIVANLSERTKKQWADQETKERMVKSLEGVNAKTYLFVDPDGNERAITNLTKFCAENNLSYSQMSRVYHGKRSECEGWKIKIK